MTSNKRKAVEGVLLDAGLFGVPRHVFENNRLRFGTSFVRRLEELESEYIIEKEVKGNFIVSWKLIGRRNPQPQAAEVKREIYVGKVCQMEFYEVCR